MASKTVSIEEMGKEFDRQVSKKHRLEDELDAISQKLWELILEIREVRK